MSMHIIRRALLLILTTLLFCADGLAQSPGPHNWQKIADLPPGTPLEVHETYARFAADCTLVWVDNNALACDTFDLHGVAQRVVYRRTEIESVQRTKLESADHGKATAVLIGMGIGGALGGLVARNAGPGPIAAFAALGMGVGGGIPAGMFVGMGSARLQPRFGVRIPLSRRSTHVFR
jgi:hypothetical protein